jgi:hypothetical protein
MTSDAQALNRLYLDEMQNASDTSTLGRVRDLWWDSFVRDVRERGPLRPLNQLDAYMVVGREQLLRMASDYATAKAVLGSDHHRQLVTQFLKSNTGKMFERFVGLALAHALMEADAAYAVNPGRVDTYPRCHGMTRDDLQVAVILGDGQLYTYIDADLFAFNPSNADDEIFLMSVKSTLKDRFHNVPFWNLLRRAASSGEFPEITPTNRQVLTHLRYIAICSDLATEQPDFGTDAGARNLLQVDAVLLDGAYVTSSRARGLPGDCTNHLGLIRQHAFYPYSCFYEYLTAKTP